VKLKAKELTSIAGLAALLEHFVPIMVILETTASAVLDIECVYFEITPEYVDLL